MSQIMRP